MKLSLPTISPAFAYIKRLAHVYSERRRLEKNERFELELRTVLPLGWPQLRAVYFQTDRHGEMRRETFRTRAVDLDPKELDGTESDAIDRIADAVNELVRTVVPTSPHRSRIRPAFRARAQALRILGLARRKP